MKGIINDLRRRLSNSQWGGAEIGNHAWLYIETQVGVDIWERVCSDACLSTEIRFRDGSRKTSWNYRGKR
jgi:hypothetical protein